MARPDGLSDLRLKDYREPVIEFSCQRCDRRGAIERKQLVKAFGADVAFAVLRRRMAAREGLQPLIEKVWGYCEANGIAAKTVTLKVKYADFNQITRSKTVPTPLGAIADMEEIVGLLLAPIFPPRKGIRLLGVTLSSLEPRAVITEPQLRLAL